MPCKSARRRPRRGFSQAASESAFTSGSCLAAKHASRATPIRMGCSATKALALPTGTFPWITNFTQRRYLSGGASPPILPPIPVRESICRFVEARARALPRERPVRACILVQVKNAALDPQPFQFRIAFTWRGPQKQAPNTLRNCIYYGVDPGMSGLGAYRRNVVRELDDGSTNQAQGRPTATTRLCSEEARKS